MFDTLNRGNFIAGAAAALLMIGAAPALADNGSKRGDARNATVSVSYSTGAVKGNTRSHKANTRDHRYTHHTKRQTFDTRYRAYIVLTEENVRGKSKRKSGYGSNARTKRICTVEARGPQARYVSKRQLRRVAQNNCAKRAQIRIVR